MSINFYESEKNDFVHKKDMNILKLIIFAPIDCSIWLDGAALNS